MFVCLETCLFYDAVANETATATRNANFIAVDNKPVYLLAEVESRGRQLAKNGDYDGAIAAYREALDPKYWTFEWETGLARGKIASILKMQGWYEDALKAMQWHLSANPEKYEPYRRELTALMEYSKTGNVAPVYEHILYRKKLRSYAMPPNNVTDTIGISDVIWLYNAIGDHDGGIAFVDTVIQILKEKKKQRGENFQIYDLVTTAEEATKCAELDKKMRQRNPDWRTCNLIRNYLLVREAFEQDKRNGFKGCVGSPPGPTCVGKATQALIQSDYFPW